VAISVDTTVALVSTTTGTAASASFNVSAGTYVVCLAGGDAGGGDAALNLAFANNKSLTVVENPERGHKEGGSTSRGSAGIASMYSSGAQTGMTVTVTNPAVSGSRAIGMKVLLLTSADTAGTVTNVNEGNSTTNAPVLSVTSTITDGLAVWAVDDWTQPGVPTWSGTGVVSAGTYNVSGEVAGGFAYAPVSATGAVNATYDSAGTAAVELSWCAAIIAADAGGGGGAAAGVVRRVTSRQAGIRASRW
jgi:hypothetical protein